MAYFSRLTDIVTCNLTTLLENEPDQVAALKQIISEMEEGLSGAQRSVGTASKNVEDLETEIGTHAQQIQHWVQKAKTHLADGLEDRARVALIRKREVEDLIAGLEQQLQAAISTRQQLHTTLRALEARLADARRRLNPVDDDGAADDSQPETPAVAPNPRVNEIDAELDRLRRELNPE